MFYALHQLIRFLFPEKQDVVSPAPAPASVGPTQASRVPQQRSSLTSLLIAGTAGLLQARARARSLPASIAVETVPDSDGQWTGTGHPIEQEVLDILRPSDYLLRVYQKHAAEAQPKTPYIDLFIPYYRSQRAGERRIPRSIAFPAPAGLRSRIEHITLTIPGHVPFPVNRYLITKGEMRGNCSVLVLGA